MFPYISWDEATKSALAEAAKTIKHTKSVYVKAVSANVENNKIVEYKTIVKLSFVVDPEL